MTDDAQLPPSTSVAPLSFDGGDEQRGARAQRDASLIVDDLRGWVRVRRRALRVWAVLSGVFSFACYIFVSVQLGLLLNPGALLFGMLIGVVGWMPIHLISGLALRLRVARLVRKAGLRTEGVVAALQLAARSPDRTSDDVVAEAARQEGLLALRPPSQHR